MGNCFPKIGHKEKPETDGMGAKASKQKQNAKKSAASTAKDRLTESVLNKQTEDVNDLYTLGKVLGRGQFGITRLATDKKTGKDFACKSIAKRKLLSKEDVEDVRREVQIMHHLKGHDNIVTLVGAFEDKANVHLVMELCSGGELFDRIVARGHYTEKDAAALVRTIVSVVAHCHLLGVVHRDLKPENFLLSTKDDDAPLKATDFGLSVFYKPGEMFTDVVGSAYYVAPEVLKRRYGKEADIWSCGVILYILLSGVPPFWGETEQQIFDAVAKGHIDFKTDPWPNVSSEAKDAVRVMLQQDPKKRATANEILQHSWMRENGTASDRPLDNVIVKRMQGFLHMNKLKKEALKVMAAGMSPEEIAGLRSLFQSLDVDKSGTVTLDELREGLAKQGSPITQKEVEALMESIDVDATGSIDYDEFLAATMNMSQLQMEENMYRAFQHFDTDNSGTISQAELREALRRLPGDLDKNIDEILAEVDKDKNGEVDYEEFCEMMRGMQSSTIKRATTAYRKGAIM
ncbi:Calcium-dependent protein kinase 2 [Coccomyxa viridis]|uniref:non-specific serine/threonine protein kinase n=1 Tax=Coccomyxa viridis TaxID=1274662 RepID=A0AAV1ILW5_9CHLO|nr:Calcium-dependent protein kinase 2 [Coccomyxa viridis]